MLHACLGLQQAFWVLYLRTACLTLLHRGAEDIRCLESALYLVLGVERMALPRDLHILVAIQHNAHLMQSDASSAASPSSALSMPSKAGRRLQQGDMSAMLYVTLQTDSRCASCQQQSAAQHTPGGACGMPAPQWLPAHHQQNIGKMQCTHQLRSMHADIL